MGIKERLVKLFGSSGNFVLRVNSSMDWDDDTMVSCVLLRGNQPKAGNRFRITRTGRVGTIADTTSLGEAFGAAMRTGASIAIMGTGSSLQSEVAFRTTGVPYNEFKQGDEIVAC